MTASPPVTTYRNKQISIMKKSPSQRITSTILPALLSLGMALSATAEQFKVATVNMTTLLNEYHKTKAAEQEEKVEMENIRKRLMDEIRVQVIESVNAYAATQDADFVFDESGLTTNQVPFLVYVRNKQDITAGVLAKLNQGASDSAE